MAYKSRVTNKYMGSTFAGRVNAATTTETSDLINVLQKNVNPALSRIYNQNIANKKDEAVQEMNQLLTTKDINTVQKEILEGKHPKLSGKYVDKTVQYHTGKFEAIDAINTIEQNKDKYDLKQTNLPAFYKEYLPSFADKEGSYALGFASVFNEYKAKEAIKDSVKRKEIAKTDRFENISKVLDSRNADDYYKQANSFIVDLPPEEGDNKKRYLNSPEEVNEIVLFNLTNSLKTASTTAEIARIENIIKADRGVGKGGNNLGSIYSNKNKPKNAKLISDLITKRNIISNAEWTASERANTKEQREGLQSIIKMDAETPSDIAAQQDAIDTLINKFPEFAQTVKLTLNATSGLLENSDALAEIKRNVSLGKYDNVKLDVLLNDIREQNGSKETISTLLDTLAASQLRRNSGYQIPTENAKYKKTLKQLNTLLADKIKTTNKYDTGKKQQLISDIVSKDLEEEWLDWNASEEGQRPSKSAPINEQREWEQKSTKWLKEKYLDYIKQYDNENWLSAMGDRMDRLSLSEYSGLDKEDKVVEYYTGEVEKFIKTLTTEDIEQIQQESRDELIPVSQLIQKKQGYQDLLATEGFQIFKDDPRTANINEGMKVVEDIMDSLNLINVDYTDALNNVKDNIAAFSSVLNIPEIQKTFGIFTNKKSEQEQGKAFIEGLSNITGRTISRQFYETNFTETDKENIAKAFNINTEQLEDLANNYLK